MALIEDNSLTRREVGISAKDGWFVRMLQ
jgi:hypothetical protein